MREVVDLDAAGPEAARATLDAILDLDRQIFEYPDDATQLRYYAATRAPAERQVAVLYRHEDQLVGYNLIRLSVVEAAGRRWSVVTSNAGLLPSHVGRSRTLPDAFALMVRWMLKEPWRRWTFVSFIVSPAAYGLLVDVNPSIAPSPAHPRLKEPERELLRVVAERSGHRIVDDKRDRLTIRLRRPAAGSRSRRPTATMDFYTERCPGFEQGEALGICAAITPMAVCSGLWRHGRRVLRRRGDGHGRTRALPRPAPRSGCALSQASISSMRTTRSPPT